jgi:hypothetical protein
MSNSTRGKPTVPLRCRKCGSTKIRVSRGQQMLRRTVRSEGVQRGHLHAQCRCMNLACKNEWWSMHPTAVTTSRELDKAEHDSRVVGPAPETGKKLRQTIAAVGG